ncbi:GRIM-19 protein [Myxozyma melibiosi]|uniref:NADH dehydrogenase [ubiquinone] 1 alpha subcomplex subunit 13 n=1 Tax=Myxozyma melibiosi TaxID=54550 RepID=A0ABR1FAL8_9ASCO
MSYHQDLPPKGGYPDVQWKRNLPSRGFRPSIYLAIMGVVSLLSVIPMSKGFRERREYSREKAWARLSLLPLLQAEADRDYVRRITALTKREQELMKDHPDWADNKPVFNDGRSRFPSYVALEATKN